MNHLLRIWEVTPCSPQPEETWEHTSLCILGKCLNHKRSAQIGAITSHPESAAGRAYEKKKKRGGWLCWNGWLRWLKFWKEWFSLSPWHTLQSEPEWSISAPVCDSASDKSHSLICASWLFYGSGVVWPVYPPLNPLFAALGKQVVLTRLWILLS